MAAVGGFLVPAIFGHIVAGSGFNAGWLFLFVISIVFLALALLAPKPDPNPLAEHGAAGVAVAS
jgi:ACS family D-galactonate transporter-like MFS transporter